MVYKLDRCFFDYLSSHLYMNLFMCNKFDSLSDTVPNTTNHIRVMEFFPNR